MPGSSRTFRVFVSSTFDDLRAERDVLQQRVFPKLAALCAGRGAHFQAIDLRWGISEEATLDQQAMPMCLAEVERCRVVSPRLNFIALLGDRYGSIAPASRILARDFDRMMAVLPREQRELIDTWYRRDDNAVPPVWNLRPRTGPYVQPAMWQPVEMALQEVLAAAAQVLPADERITYRTSATEQEIIAGAYPMAAAGQPVFAFLRTIHGAPSDGSASRFVDSDPGQAPAIKRLKQEVRRRLQDGVHEYRADWTGGGPSLVHLDALARDVHQALAGVITQELDQLGEADPVSLERHNQWATGRRLLSVASGLGEGSTAGTETFVGREEALSRINAYLEEGPTQPLGVFGAAGIGKSALMAKMATMASERWPTARVLTRFVGTTSGSGDAQALMAGLCQELAQTEGSQPPDSTQGYADLISVFWTQLQKAQADRPIIVFVDALDQLAGEPRARQLAWLPRRLPEHVGLVVSTLPGECLDRLRAMEIPVWELGAMPRHEGEELIDRWLASVNRTLTTTQRDEVLDKFTVTGRPLYLRLAFSEAVRWASYEAPVDLAADVPGIIRGLFDRLRRGDQHGPALVDHTVGFLAASRFGLAEDELLDVLSHDATVMEECLRRTRPEWRPGMDHVPAVLWSRLWLDLEPYLTERLVDHALLTGFYHRKFQVVAAAEHSGDGSLQERHAGLAAYFRRRADPGNDRSWSVGDVRSMRELPHHLLAADRLEELHSTLTDLRYLERKATDVDATTRPDGAGGQLRMHRGAFLVRDDLQRALDHWPASAPDERRVLLQQLARALRLDSDILVEKPNLLFQQLTNRLCWTPGPAAELLAAEARRRALQDPRPWLRLAVPFSESAALLQSIRAHDRATSCSISSDSRFIVSGSWEGTVKIWDSDTGDLLNVLPGHGGRVNSCQITPDGRMVISVDNRGVVRCWDWDGIQGHLRAERSGHAGEASDCCVSSDGRSLITVGADGRVLIWDIDRLRPRTLWKQPGVRFRACAMSPDGRRLVAGDAAGTLRVWCIGGASPVLEATRVLHGRPVTSCAVSPHGRRIASADSHGTVRLTNLELETDGDALELPHSAAEDCTFSPDGGSLLCCGAHGTLRVWDVETRDTLATLAGHAGTVFAVTVSRHSELIVSAGVDGSVKLWDFKGASHGPPVSRQVNMVCAVAISREGDRVASADVDGDIRIRDGVAGTELQALDACREFCQDMAISPDGTWVSAADRDGTLEVWPVGDAPTSEVSPRRLPHADITVCGAGLAGMAVSAGMDGSVKGWQVKTGALVWEGDAKATVVSCTVSPDDRRVVTTGMDGRLIIWGLMDGELLATLQGHEGTVWRCAISPSGDLVASVGKDGTVRLWDLRGGPTPRSIVLGRHDAQSLGVAFSPDSRLLVSAGANHRVGVWEVADRLQRGWLDGHRAAVRACAVTADSRYVVSAGDDKMLRVWEAETGIEVTSLGLQGGTPRLLAHPTRNTLICGDDGGGVYLAELITSDLAPDSSTDTV